MSEEKIIEGIVKVVMPLNGGFTKVVWEQTIGIGLADGGIEIDIPTRIIPFSLRNFGSRFYLRIKGNQTEIKELEE